MRWVNACLILMLVCLLWVADTIYENEKLLSELRVYQRASSIDQEWSFVSFCIAKVQSLPSLLTN